MASVSGVSVMTKQQKTMYEAWGNLSKSAYQFFKPLIDELEKAAEKVARWLDD